MSHVAFTTSLTLAAALLAVWLDLRLGDTRPDGIGRRIGHAVVGFLLLQLASGLLVYARDHGLAPSKLMVGVLLLFAPALVYALLTGLWLMRTLADVARLARR
jgi:hypothetical protein